MKIILTGGGTGGHFYPVVAVAEEVRTVARGLRLLPPKLLYMAPEPYDQEMLFEHDIAFSAVPAGKRRRYTSIKNFFDFFTTAWGTLLAILKVFMIFPDVIFGKGGYASFPALCAARIFGIPVVLHESDVVPGKVNLWASRFAKRIAISFPETAALFPEEAHGKIALTGNPVRTSLHSLSESGAEEYLHLEEGVPVLLVLGGSQGAQHVNKAVLEALPLLVEKYQIIHQTGATHIAEIEQTSGVLLERHPHKQRYKPFGFLNTLALRMAAGKASLIVTRAGAGAIFEVALWGKPAILVPIAERISDQKKNAFAYARAGACVVIEEDNLTPHLLISEIDRLMNDSSGRQRMSAAAHTFATPDAARKIAQEIIDLALEHEKPSRE